MMNHAPLASVVLVEDLGELAASGARAVEFTDEAGATVYVDRGLSEAERTVAIARLDASRAKTGRAGQSARAMIEFTAVGQADRYVSQLIAGVQETEPGAADILSAVDTVVARVAGTPYLRVLVTEFASRALVRLSTVLTTDENTEALAFVLLAIVTKLSGDDAAAMAWLGRGRRESDGRAGLTANSTAGAAR